MSAGPSGRSVEGVGLRPLARWDCEFESHRRHGCLSVVSVVCCQVEVSAIDWSLVQRSSTDCGASLFVIQKPRKWGGAMGLWKIQPKGCNAKKTNKQIMFVQATSILKNSMVILMSWWWVLLFWLHLVVILFSPKRRRYSNKLGQTLFLPSSLFFSPCVTWRVI